MNQQTNPVAVMPCMAGLTERMNQSAKTVMELEQEGFDVFAIDVLKDKMPTLQIRPHPVCQTLIRMELATYYKRNAYERWGQFTRNDCRVIWREQIKPEATPCA